jgi:hypothetical protein
MKLYENLTSHFGSSAKYKSPTAAQRRKMPDRCFLIPGKKKYPICNVHGNKVTCDALHAAYRRANMVLNDPRPHKGRSDAAIARAFAGQYIEKLGCKSKHNHSKFG